MAKLNYNDLRARADRVSQMIVDRARKVAAQSGLDPAMPFHMAHNAMCSYGTQQQWREVNYDGARLVLHLQELSWRPRNLIDSIYKRRGPDGFIWNAR